MNLAFVMGSVSILLAFILTKQNSKYILSGYNTMTEESRKNVDIDSYLRWFKKFNIWVGISTIALGILFEGIAPDLADVFVISYTIISFAFLGFTSEKYFKPSNTARVFSRIISSFLVLVAIGIVSFSLISFKDSTLIFEKTEMEITGIYGIRVRKDDIQKIKLLKELPAISSRTNGFNGGSYRKGNFRTRDGRRIKLFVNLNSDHFLLISTNEEDIYFSWMATNMHDVHQKAVLWKGKGTQTR